MASYTTIRETGSSFFLLGRVDSMGLDIHGETVHLRLHGKVFELPEVIRIILLNDDDGSTGAGGVDPFQP